MSGVPASSRGNTPPVVFVSPDATSDFADLFRLGASNRPTVYQIFTSGDGEHHLVEDGSNFIYTSNGTDNPGEIMRIREYDVRFENATSTGTLLFVDRANNKLGFFNHAAAVQQTGVAVSAAAIHAALVNFGLITA